MKVSVVLLLLLCLLGATAVKAHRQPTRPGRSEHVSWTHQSGQASILGLGFGKACQGHTVELPV